MNEAGSLDSIVVFPSLLPFVLNTSAFRKRGKNQPCFNINDL